MTINKHSIGIGDINEYSKFTTYINELEEKLCDAGLVDKELFKQLKENNLKEIEKEKEEETLKTKALEYIIQTIANNKDNKLQICNTVLSSIVEIKDKRAVEDLCQKLIVVVEMVEIDTKEDYDELKKANESLKDLEDEISKKEENRERVDSERKKAEKESRKRYKEALKRLEEKELRTAILLENKKNTKNKRNKRNRP